MMTATRAALKRPRRAASWLPLAPRVSKLRSLRQSTPRRSVPAARGEAAPRSSGIRAARCRSSRLPAWPLTMSAASSTRPTWTAWQSTRVSPRHSVSSVAQTAKTAMDGASPKRSSTGTPSRKSFRQSGPPKTARCARVCGAGRKSQRQQRPRSLSSRWGSTRRRIRRSTRRRRASRPPGSSNAAEAIRARTACSGRRAQRPWELSASPGSTRRRSRHSTR
mmetsp:Transcript_10801/g.31990  ORF Transcript_10801/g.31990 Transcript_10801/m.31990 type:complete len:221 (-) Transcript_10801:1225-1887(-)